MSAVLISYSSVSSIMDQVRVANVVTEFAAGKGFGFLFSNHGDVALRGFEGPLGPSVPVKQLPIAHMIVPKQEKASNICYVPYP